MAEFKNTAPVAPSSSGTASFVKRELHGATFLTLEHVAHMVLIAVVAALVTAGIVTALSIWTGGLSATNPLALMTMAGTQYLTAHMAVGIVSALLVCVPLLIVLDRRTRAEWVKRPGYASRVAYKVPVYGALGVLAGVKIVAGIQMISVVLLSLAMIGTSSSEIGNLYTTQFVPSAITALVFGASAWYVFALAKGRDLGKLFSTGMAAAGAVLAVALFITAIVTLHGSDNGTNGRPLRGGDYYNTSPGGAKDLEDIFRY